MKRKWGFRCRFECCMACSRVVAVSKVWANSCRTCVYLWNSCLSIHTAGPHISITTEAWSMAEDLLFAEVNGDNYPLVRFVNRLTWGYFLEPGLRLVPLNRWSPPPPFYSTQTKYLWQLDDIWWKPPAASTFPTRSYPTQLQAGDLKQNIYDILMIYYYGSLQVLVLL